MIDSENSHVNLSIYNPNLQSDDNFLKGFVARRRTAKLAFERLKEIPKSGLASHFLFLGQRGMGKSSMLKRISIEISLDPDLSANFIPLKFREEQYNIHSMDVFWQNCIDSLSDWFEEQGNPEKSDIIDQRHSLNVKDQENSELYFKRICSETDRRPILLLDNIDIILAGLGDEQWSFRKSLQDRNGPIVVGASANYMEAITDPKEAFFEFFQVVVLEKLSPQDVNYCLRKIAAERGGPGEAVLKMLENDPGRIQTLCDMTGGNPRTLTLLYLLFENDGRSDVFGDLESLLDEVTVLYKARVEDLSSQSRVVFDALALNWNPITGHDLGKITKLKTSTVTAQLDRLRKSGLIEKVSLPKITKTAYQVSERFFNIWYLMRHAPRRQRVRLRWLVEFLKIFYSPQQLTDKVIHEFKKDDLSPRKLDIYYALEGAIEDPRWRKLIGSRAVEQDDGKLGSDEWQKPETSEDWRQQAELQFFNLQDTESAIKSLQTALELDPQNEKAALRLARVHLSNDDKSLALELAEKLVSQFPEFAAGHSFLAWCHITSMEDDSRSIAHFEKAISLESNNPDFYYDYAQFLNYHSSKPDYEKSEEMFAKALSISPDDVETLIAYANLCRFRLTNYLQARDLLQHALSISPSDPEARLGYAFLLVDAPHLDADTDIEREFNELRTIGGDIGARSFNGLAYYFEKSGQYDKLVKLHENEMKDDPSYDNVEVRSHVGDIYLDNLGNLKKAVYNYKKAIKIDTNNSFELSQKSFLQSYFFGEYDRGLDGYIQSESLEKKGKRPSIELALESNILALKFLTNAHDSIAEGEIDENLERHPDYGRHMMLAIYNLSIDNFGEAFSNFKDAMYCNNPKLYDEYKGFLVVFLKTCYQRQYFAKLIDGLERTGLADRYMPVYHAILAMREGEEYLSSVNPEVRKVANRIYGWLSYGLNN